MHSRFAIRRCISLCALLLGSIWGGSPAQAQTTMNAALQPVKQSSRIASNADYGLLVPLDQALPRWVAVGGGSQAVDLGATLQVSIVLSREPSLQAALNGMLAAQQNPRSAMFHQWLTAQQVGELYGPTANDLAAVTSWLESQGLKVEGVSPNGLIIRASGSLAAVGGAFHTSFGMFSVNGKQRLSAMSQPLIPAALSSLVRSVHGLSQTRYEPQSKVSVRALPATRSDLTVRRSDRRPSGLRLLGNHVSLPRISRIMRCWQVFPVCNRPWCLPVWIPGWRPVRTWDMRVKLRWMWTG